MNMQGLDQNSQSQDHGGGQDKQYNFHMNLESSGSESSEESLLKFDDLDDEDNTRKPNI